MPRQDLEWKQAMDIWANLSPEQYSALREAAIRHLIDGGAEEVGSSDINHVVYGFVNSGTYLDEIRNQGVEA